jgi:GWxTD domain-containing protein
MFWSRRDPNPATDENEALEEYLTRVRIVTERFSAMGPGWRTDRGRIYIQYGEPERIERLTDSQYRGEYEIWRYYSLNRVFVFYDMFGLGDFRLVEGDFF